MTQTSRLDGLDLARCLAFFGMVIVNFTLAMGADAASDPGLLATIEQGLQGRAAATFVTLAGLGLGLAANRRGHGPTLAVTLKRAAFLFGAGLVNMLIFPADILHYYGVYFALGGLMLAASRTTLVAGMVAVTVIAVLLMQNFDYMAGWNWQTFDYTDFWTPAGFVRNLAFNGFHPLFPWFGFFLFGVLLSRLDLAQPMVATALAIAGALALVLAELLASALTAWVLPIDANLAFLTTTQPIPPMPLFVMAGLGAASLVIGLCLHVGSHPGLSALLAPLRRTGRMTLTLYIAHILVGMGTLETLGLLHAPGRGQGFGAVFLACLVFCALAVAFAALWSRRFDRGPAEMLMRRLAG